MVDLPEKLEADTTKTLTDKQELTEKIRLAKENRHSIDDAKYELGRVCVGVPVRGTGNRIVASVRMSTTTVEMAPEKFETIVL